MLSFLTRILIVYVVTMSASFYGQSPVDIVIKVTGENIFSSPVQTPDLILGLDQLSTDGLEPDDDFDELRLSESRLPAPVDLDEAFFFIGEVGQMFTLIKDVKPYLANLVWRIRLEFGVKSSPPPGRDIELSWADTNGTSLFAGLPFHRIELIDGNNVRNMLNTVTYSIKGNSGDTPEIRIELQNPPPMAVEDSAIVLKNGSVVIDVLGNDSDPLNGNLTVEILPNQEPQTGMAVVIENGKKIEYTHSGNSLEDVTFSYTVSNEFDNASAMVTVEVSDIIFTRSHSDFAVPDQGLQITVKIDYTDLGGNEILTLSESFPSFDNDPASFYTVAPGSGIGGFEISGDQPESVIITGENTIFTWDPNDGSPLPANSISFKYRVIGNQNDREEKCISGILTNGPNGSLEEFKTSFMPVQKLHHDADLNKDSKIGFGEVFRVIDLFNLGSSYCCDETNTDDGFSFLCNESLANTCDVHDADLNMDWRIDFGEVFRAIDLFNQGGFYQPDPESEDGFAQSETDPF